MKLTKIRFSSYLIFGILLLLSGIYFFITGNILWEKVMFVSGGGQLLIFFVLTAFFNREILKKKNG